MMCLILLLEVSPVHARKTHPHGNSARTRSRKRCLRTSYGLMRMMPGRAGLAGPTLCRANCRSSRAGRAGLALCRGSTGSGRAGPASVLFCLAVRRYYHIPYNVLVCSYYILHLLCFGSVGFMLFSSCFVYAMVCFSLFHSVYFFPIYFRSINFVKISGFFFIRIRFFKSINLL